ncbi:Bifunctional protein GlmU [Frankliniella fusca]|uniref:Bifunctional protein GlmU n=1 Tax=Frankliniella fusca TaxID=407009 RepID=A0AAE1HPM7_9NEOP|nr:Bifunctional protein GlmU [Frankliniella fusca]
MKPPRTSADRIRPQPQPLSTAAAMQRLSLVLLVTCAVAALAVAEPEPRGKFRAFLHNAHVKLSLAEHKVAHAMAPNIAKLKSCLLKTPGVPAAVQGVVTGCVGAGGMGAIAACAAKKAAIPAARATSHLAVCMG